MAARPGLIDRLNGWRDGVRRRPGGHLTLKIATLALGVGFIVLGLVLVVLPGPLTIPPILVGLYILASEFAWADRLLERAKHSGREAWQSAKKKPVLTGVTTVAGLVAAGLMIWAASYYDLVAKAKDVVGL